MLGFLDTLLTLFIKFNLYPYCTYVFFTKHGYYFPLAENTPTHFNIVGTPHVSPGNQYEPLVSCERIYTILTLHCVFAFTQLNFLKESAEH